MLRAWHVGGGENLHIVTLLYPRLTRPPTCTKALVCYGTGPGRRTHITELLHRPDAEAKMGRTVRRTGFTS